MLRRSVCWRRVSIRSCNEQDVVSLGLTRQRRATERVVEEIRSERRRGKSGRKGSVAELERLHRNGEGVGGWRRSLEDGREGSEVEGRRSLDGGNGSGQRMRRRNRRRRWRIYCLRL